jgi:hypothetical protein
LFIYGKENFEVYIMNQTPKWPTLQGRLNNPLTSRAEAIKQLKITTPITETAKNVLKRDEKQGN